MGQRTSRQYMLAASTTVTLPKIQCFVIRVTLFTTQFGLMLNHRISNLQSAAATVYKGAEFRTGVPKMQDWKMTDQIAGVENDTEKPLMMEVGTIPT